MRMKIEFENEDEFHRFVKAMADGNDCCPDNFGLERVDAETCVTYNVCKDCWEGALRKAMVVSE